MRQEAQQKTSLPFKIIPWVDPLKYVYVLKAIV